MRSSARLADDGGHFFIGWAGRDPRPRPDWQTHARGGASTGTAGPAATPWECTGQPPRRTSTPARAAARGGRGARLLREFGGARAEAPPEPRWRGGVRLAKLRRADVAALLRPDSPAPAWPAPSGSPVRRSPPAPPTGVVQLLERPIIWNSVGVAPNLEQNVNSHRKANFLLTLTRCT